MSISSKKPKPLSLTENTTRSHIARKALDANKRTRGIIPDLNFISYRHNMLSENNVIAEDYKFKLILYNILLLADIDNIP